MRREIVPADLSKVKTKVAFNLTKRQLICFGLAAAIGIPCYLLTRGLGNSVATFITMFVVMPCFLFAVYEKNGQPMEVYLRHVWHFLKTPKKRPYQTENLYTILVREATLRATVSKIVCSSQRDKPKAKKKKGKEV